MRAISDMDPSIAICFSDFISFTKSSISARFLHTASRSTWQRGARTKKTFSVSLLATRFCSWVSGLALARPLNAQRVTPRQPSPFRGSEDDCIHDEEERAVGEPICSLMARWGGLTTSVELSASLSSACTSGLVESLKVAKTDRTIQSVSAVPSETAPRLLAKDNDPARPSKEESPRPNRATTATSSTAVAAAAAHRRMRCASMFVEEHRKNGQRSPDRGVHLRTGTRSTSRARHFREVDFLRYALKANPGR